MFSHALLSHPFCIVPPLPPPPHCAFWPIGKLRVRNCVTFVFVFNQIQLRGPGDIGRSSLFTKNKTMIVVLFVVNKLTEHRKKVKEKKFCQPNELVGVVERMPYSKMAV